MKAIVILLFVAIAATGLLLAQGRAGSNNIRDSKFMSYDPGTPPPLTLPEAYSMALTNLGADTNRFYCVSASCVEHTNRGFTGWYFVFSNTNRERDSVVVHFNREVRSVLRDKNGAVLQAK